MFNINEKFWEIVNRLLDIDFDQGWDDFSLAENDLYTLNIGGRGEGLFLGYYSVKGLELIFNKYHIFEKIRKKGYGNPRILLDTSDPYKHRLRVVNEEGKKPLPVLIDLIVRSETVCIDLPYKSPQNGKKYETLAIEWLQMQDVCGQFSTRRPRLPGQDHPGLGIGSEALELLVIAARRVGLQGIVNIPNHFHNAYFYSRIFHYENPREQAKLKAILRDLGKMPLYKLAWAMEEGAVLDAVSNKPFEWFTGRQVFPLISGWSGMYRSRPYKKAVENYMKDYKFKLDDNWTFKEENR
ncbi:MAG TPA: hypothetical protein ENJ15_03460 [Caldithrix abyssi]|uniref:Uncharacterized protein n=1 Tax=Caldithrix abyssi TaxID=187145 RepID=A0A7V5VEK3_CALAY|nr:hypothetical protein [Caldithrix abyssi]